VDGSIRTSLHISAGDKDIREALKHEYTITRGAKHTPSRHDSTTDREDEDDAEPQQVLLGDQEIELATLPAPSEAPAPQSATPAQIRRKPLPVIARPGPGHNQD